MKKHLALLLFLISAAVLYASDGMTFYIVPSDGPLYREPLADPYAFVSRIEIQKAIDPDLRPAKVRASVEVYDGSIQLPTQYIDLPYDQNVINNPGKFSTYLHMRTALSSSLCRFVFDDSSSSVPKLEAEVSLSGALNTIFNIFSNSNALDFDGTWFAGVNAEISDTYLLRFGIHHFSGHYGDETLDKFYETNRVDFNDNGRINADFEGRNPEYDYYIHNLVEYVRDNYWIAGTSVSLPHGFRIYGEFEWPWNDVWLRPFSSTPVFNDSPEGDSLLEYVGSTSEGFTDEQVAAEKELKTGSGYHAYRAHAGIEYRRKLSADSAFFAAMDIQFHQDGQTLHMPNSYSPDNPWEKEYTVNAGVEFGNVVPGRCLRTELIYHDGRVSGTDFFYQRTKTVSLSFSVS